MKSYKLKTPLNDNDIKNLHVGDKVLISGKVYTARDQAHLRMVQAIKAGKKLPMNLKNEIIYYCGPTPKKPGRVIGSAGPTTAGRMDPSTPALLAKGLKGMIGKGKRSREVRDAIRKYKAVYFAATGGAGALLSGHIKTAAVKAYPKLGPEAIYELELKDFPAIVANDIYGKDIFEEGIKKWRVK